MKKLPLLGILGSLFIFSIVFLYGYSVYELKMAERRISQMVPQPVVSTVSPTLPSVIPDTGVPDVVHPSALQGLPDEVREALLGSFPFSENTYKQVRELSSDLFIVLLGPPEHGSVWILDVKKKRATSLTNELETDAGNYVWLQEWANGIAIRKQLSPGEAIAQIHTMYVDVSGKVVAHTEYGDYGRQPQTMDASIQDVPLSAELVQKGSCVSEGWLPEKGAMRPPKTVLTGIRLNGKVFSFPNPINVFCALAYGDGITNPGFPEPSFDGMNVTFRVPGYDVFLKKDGTVVYQSRVAYQITCGSDYFVMTKEDATGEHEMENDFLNDPKFKDQIKNYDVACLRIVGFDESVFHFLLQGFDDTRGEYYSRATFDYDTRTQTVGRLYSLNDLSYDQNQPTAHLACGSDFQVYLEEIKHDNRQHLTLFEACVRARRYPFRTFPIPGEADSYFGFMGNEKSTSPPHAEGPVCIIDGRTQGCLLYRVKDGELATLALHDDNTRALLQTQPFSASSPDSLVIQHLPYEICYGTWYESFDFVQNTSTARLLDYYTKGSCDEETAIIFYPTKTRSVKVVIDTQKMSSDNRIGLIFEGKNIGTITATGIGDWNGGTLFPQEQDLAAYVQQADRNSFSFSVGKKRFNLDLRGSIPRLEER